MKFNPPNKLKMLGVEDVRKTNELKLLHIIRDRQPISRVDLVKATGLRPGTVSVIVNRLLRASVVHEGEMAPSSGGRPATYLQINAEKAHVIGISIGVHQTVYGVGDFNGRILDQRTMSTGRHGENFLQELCDEISTQLSRKFRRGRLAGIGVSVSGLVDRANGCLVRSPNLGWSDVPITQILEARLNLPVQVENDANAAALSELWYGPMDVWSAQCLLFVLIVEGIGTGLILNGEVYTGSRIGMGGFGHIPLDPCGPVCSCGSVGCWETLASDAATLARFAADKRSTRPVPVSLTDLIRLAQAGDAAAMNALALSATFSGRAIKGLSHGLAPDVVVIGGQITAGWPLIAPFISNELQGEYLLNDISRPQLRAASVENPAFLGAFSVGLRTVLQKPARR
jgi:predicted NBD/HSP70 family sugar kinase